MTDEARSADPTPTADSVPRGAAANPPMTATRQAERMLVAASTGAREIGGRHGPEPTRYGDWELRGRCIDF